MTGAGPEVGQPVVLGGRKYRIREITSSRVWLVAAAPKRNPTHRATLYGSVFWDRVVGVWRLYSGEGKYELKPLPARKAAHP